MTWEIRQGNALDRLREIPDGTIQTCVTSPPYFNLRDYGIEGQIGIEDSPAEYVARLVEVFCEVRRTLRSDGTCWINLGDSFANDGKWGGASGGKHAKALHGNTGVGRRRVHTGLKPKDLIGIPWRVAFALQADGWHLRSDIIWHKPYPMAESVKDRPTKSHEHIFLLSKSTRYFYDAEAIAEPSCRLDRPQTKRALQLAEEHNLTAEHLAAIRAVGITDTGKAQVTQIGFGKNIARVRELAAEAKAALGGYYREFLISTTRNKRDVWTVPTQSFKEAHFATFPAALIEPCILAGSREGDTVLDPFSGAGTTGLVATEKGRNYIGIELNPSYCAMSERRLSSVMPLFEGVA